MTELARSVGTDAQVSPELTRVAQELLAIPGLWDMLVTLMEQPTEENALIHRNDTTGELHVEPVSDHLLVPEAALHFMNYPYNVSDLEEVAE